MLVARNRTGGASKQCIVRFNTLATDGFDLKYDGYYLQGYGPVFYAVADNKRLSVNTLPSLSNHISVPLSFVSTGPEEYSIEMQEQVTGARVYLRDKKLNQTINLSQQHRYDFTSTDIDSPDRFELSFNTVGMDEQSGTDLIQAWIINDKLYISSPEELKSYEVFDLKGRLLQTGDVAGKGSLTVPVNLPAGFYLVKLIGESRCASVKVVNF